MDRTIGGWQNVIRILHLGGGLRAFNNPGVEVLLAPSRSGEQPITFTISSYPHLFSETRARGLSIIGCEFLDDPEEINGLRAPDWRPLLEPFEGLTWPAFDVEQGWAQIRGRARTRPCSLEPSNVRARAAYTRSPRSVARPIPI